MPKGELVAFSVPSGTSTPFRCPKPLRDPFSQDYFRPHLASMIKIRKVCSAERVLAFFMFVLSRVSRGFITTAAEPPRMFQLKGGGQDGAPSQAVEASFPHEQACGNRESGEDPVRAGEAGIDEVSPGSDACKDQPP
jgi:hypothetical protein